MQRWLDGDWSDDDFLVLKPGQQIVVPPLSAEDERTSRLPRVPRPVPAVGPSSDGKPIFD